jgi:hypothetical protein
MHKIKTFKCKILLAEWLKWYGTCLASMTPGVQKPVPQKRKDFKKWLGAI